MTRVISSPSHSSDTGDEGHIPWISYDEIINEELTSYRHFEEWRARLEDYLRQEDLLYVVKDPPCVPLGDNLKLEQRTYWIERMVDEARVKAVLLHTTPLENFKDYKAKSAHDILKQVERECAAAAKREEELPGRGKKRKRDADGGEGQ